MARMAHSLTSWTVTFPEVAILHQNSLNLLTSSVEILHQEIAILK